MVTGAAGAIGSAIAEGLLENGCHVALTDLAGPALDNLVAELKGNFGERVTGVPLDVTDPASVAQGFEAVIKTWGGVDLVIINAGVALVSSLEQMDLAAFQRVERVNTEGTLLLLRKRPATSASREPAATSFWFPPRTSSCRARSSAPTAPPRPRRINWPASPARKWRKWACASTWSRRMPSFRMERAARACGRRSALTACARADWMKRDWRNTTRSRNLLKAARDRAARLARRAVLRHAANAHHRRHDSRGRRVAGFDTAVSKRYSKLEMTDFAILSSTLTRSI